MKKLAILRKFSINDMNYINKELSKFYDIFYPAELSEKSLISLIDNSEACVCNRISKSVLVKANRLKLIQVPGAGVNLFNFDLLKKNKIILCNSHSNARYVAEYGIALMFSLLKKIHHHDRFMREGKWFTPKNDNTDMYFLSESMIGKKVGILGFGNVGRSVANFASALGMNVIFYDPFKQDEDKFKYVSFEKLVRNSDILFITTALTSKTYNLINTSSFDIMKKNAYIINISRGAIIEEDALYNALFNNKIRGAAIDVWYDLKQDGEKKYPSKRYNFHKLDNIVLSPYRAGYNMNESPHLYDAIENLKRFANGKNLINVVDISKEF